MSTRTLCLAAVALCLAVAPRAARAQELYTRYYDNSDGLPQGQVLALYQDAAGYMWFGTYGGLTRYDGYEFRTWSERNGLPSNTVRAITESAGTLWVATERGLCAFDRVRISCDETLITALVQALAVDDDGAIWVGTPDEVDEIVDGRVHRRFPGVVARQLVVGPDGRLWAATPSGAVRLDGSRWTSVGGTEREALAVAPGRDGALIATPDGIFRADSAGAHRLPGPAGRLVAVDLARDGSGTMWGVSADGVVRVAGDSVRVFPLSDEVAGVEPYAVVPDREGNVWLGMSAGIGKMVPGLFSIYGEDDGLPHPFVRALASDHLGRIWVGTRAGVAVGTAAGFEPVPLPGDTPPRVYAIAEGAPGEILIGTREGLIRWTESGARLLTTADGLPHDFVASLVRRGDGSVWIGTSLGVVAWRDGRIAAPSGMTIPDRPLRMVEDGAGRVWMALSRGGLLVADGDRLRRLGREEGVTDQTVWDLHVGEAGVWVGTNGDGAVLVSDAGTQHVGREQGLTNDFVWQVLEDARGDQWFYTNQGLFRRSADRVVAYREASGLFELEGSATAALEDAQGFLWFGTAGGLFRFDGQREDPAAGRIPLIVQELTADGVGYDLGDARIAPRPREVSISLAALTFRDDGNLRFRYRIRNRGDEWSTPSRTPRFQLRDLSPGHYVVEVGANHWGGTEAAATTSVEFRVRPTLMQSRPMRAALVLLAGVLILAGVRMWTRALRARAREFEAQVAVRTRELRAKNEDMELQHLQLVSTIDELRETRAELVAMAHKAGMADNATGVLHNVGNLLNSVQASAGRIAEVLADGALARLTRANDLLRENLEHLGDFFADDPRGAKLAAYYLEIERGLLDQRTLALGESRRVLAKTGTIADVIANQQRMASQPTPLVHCDILQLVEDAVDMMRGSFERHHIRTDIESDPVSPVEVVRVHVVHILLNLIKNAKEAIQETGREDGHIRIEVRAVDGSVRVLVRDNGAGIDPDVRPSIFTHSFTTKPDGHGFGLHSCANYMSEMGGRIEVESEGVGRGATFTLVFPVPEGVSRGTRAEVRSGPQVA